MAEEDLAEDREDINSRDFLSHKSLFMQHTSRCIRCGKMRVVAKSWSEKINNSLVTYTLTICPDPECQRIVEEQLQKKKDKITSMHKEAEKRKKDNIRNRQIRKTLLSSGTKRHFRI